VCGNTRGFLAVHTGLVSQCLERHGTAAQQANELRALTSGQQIGCFALTEDGAGSDVASLQCRAERTSGGWVISGQKIWITNGAIADLVLVFATEDPSAGKQGISGFLVPGDAPGLRRAPMPGVELGHRGGSHAQLGFDGVQVTDAQRVGAPGNGFQVAMDALFFGRLSVAAGAVGIHRACLESSVAFAKQRQQFGRKSGSFQMVQERIADLATSLCASRLLVHRCARLMGRDTCEPQDLAMAKVFATEAAFTAAEQAVLLHGGRGYSSEYPVERHLRDAMGMRIYEGTTLIQKAIIAKQWLGEVVFLTLERSNAIATRFSLIECSYTITQSIE
jgi:alkylation response protein AidB-like acyl-CoA dehydrogenase